MVFKSLPFLFAFLPVIYVAFWMLKRRTQRCIWLTVTGDVSYAS